MVRRVLHVLLLVPLVACQPPSGPGNAPPPGAEPPPAVGSVHGYAIKGPIRNATVEVFKLGADLTRGERVGSGSTELDGAFDVQVGRTEGPLLIVVKGGSYVEEATGAVVNESPVELTAIVPTFAAGSRVAAMVNPVTHLATAHAEHSVRVLGVPLATAVTHSLAELGNHFGAFDWRGSVPADVTQSGSPTMDSAARAGLLLAALSELAREIGARANRPSFSALELLAALHTDLQNGLFDGKGPAGDVTVPAGAGALATRLDGHTMRLALADAVQRFIASPRYKRSFMAAEIRALQDGLATATNRKLFLDDGKTFDLDPPTLTMSSTFTNGRHVNRLPLTVGGERYVAGAVTVRATAADPAGVASLTVTANGAPLSGSAGSTPYAYEATFFPIDGVLTLTAEAVDSRGNRASRSETVRVDRTAPSINWSAPGAGEFFPGGFNVSAVASDATAVTSFEVLGLASFQDLNGLPEVISGSYTHPRSAQDGEVRMRLWACDVLDNCTPELPRSVFIDRTAPTVSFTSAVPAWTNALTTRIAVATGPDLSGIREVLLQHNGRAPVRMTSEGGTYSAVITNAPGSNTIVVWAVDNVGNSGEPIGASPHVERLAYFQDTTPPQIINARPSTGYRSERDVTLSATNTLENYGPASPTVLGDPLHKLPTAFGTAQQFSVGDNASVTNPANVPWLQFRVPYTAGAEAPIQSADYTLACIAGCGGTGNINTGSLLATQVDASHRDYVLPINLGTAPFLGQINAAAARLSIEIRVQDAAGNSTLSLGTVDLSVVVPPVRITEDAQWVATRPSGSAYAHSPTSQLFADLYRTEQRMLRYVVENPHELPVAVALGTTTAAPWTASESWGHPRAQGGFATGPTTATFWDPALFYVVQPQGCGVAGTAPKCSAPQIEVVDFSTGATTTSCAAAQPTATSPGPFAGHQLAMSAFHRDPATGGDGAALALSTHPSGQRFAVVPARGSAVIYLTGAFTRGAGGKHALTWDNGFHQNPGGNTYALTSSAFSQCPMGDRLTYRDETYTRDGWFSRLEGARIIASGSTAITTHARYGAEFLGTVKPGTALGYSHDLQL